jgi:hypothetical protein
MEAVMQVDSDGSLPNWTLVTSHGIILLYVALHPNATIRHIAAEVDLTERRVADVISDLQAADLLIVSRRGRRNHYTLNPAARFLHPVMAEVPFNAFVDLVRRFAARRNGTLNRAGAAVMPLAISAPAFPL